MRTSRALVTILAIVGMATGLAACTAGPEAQPTLTEAAPSATSTPTATPVPVVIGAADQPPALLGGDCSRLLPLTVLSQALGEDVTAIAAEELPRTAGIRNLGGVRCVWESGVGGGFADVIPTAALEQFDAVPLRGAYDRDDTCDWSCTWTWQDDYVWLGAISWREVQPDRSTRDAWAEEIGPALSANVADEMSWTRSTDGWWSTLDCDAVAADVGGNLGVDFVRVVDRLPGDVPPSGHIVADRATDVTECSFFTSAGGALEIRAQPGLAWAAPPSNDDVEYLPSDLGVPGITAWVLEDSGGIPYSFALIDGVNQMDVYQSPLPDSEFDATAAATAIARLMTSDLSS